MQPSHIFYSILWNLDFSDIPSLDCKLQIVGLYKVHCDPTRLRWKATQRMHFKHCAWIESSLKPPNTIFGWGMYFPWDAGLKDTKLRSSIFFEFLFYTFLLNMNDYEVTRTWMYEPYFWGIQQCNEDTQGECTVDTGYWSGWLSRCGSKQLTVQWK